MALPLYRLKEEYEQERNGLIRSISGNSGLVFNKYFNRWETDREINGWDISSEGKNSWIKAFSNRPVGNRNLLSEAVERMLSLAKFTNGEFYCYKTTWRFVTGLGLNHPLENGMAWHHTLGVPYLPGSSVKGSVRAYVELWLDSHPQQDIDRIFGPKNTGTRDDSNLTESAGSIIFYDALPVEPVQLTPDVMTPHYQDYYRKGEVPGDWMDPNPIPFLTIAEEQVFMFVVAPRNKTTAEQDLTMVSQWIAESLGNIGAGAKTATGYGRFKRCEQTEKKLKTRLNQREKEERMPVSSIPSHLAGPLAEDMVKDQYDTNPNEFLPILKKKWLVKMQAEDTAQNDRQTIANLLKNWFQVYRKSQWEKPNRKNTPAVQAIRKMLDKE
ncbi:MAG: type III-B CRISPR module RAMP protein Cmr6 [Dethiobacteria bacterium]|jgi:CRISPR-associated protein Cmr6